MFDQDVWGEFWVRQFVFWLGRIDLTLETSGLDCHMWKVLACAIIAFARPMSQPFILPLRLYYVGRIPSGSGGSDRKLHDNIDWALCRAAGHAIWCMIWGSRTTRGINESTTTIITVVNVVVLLITRDRRRKKHFKDICSIYLDTIYTRGYIGWFINYWRVVICVTIFLLEANRPELDFC